MEPHSEAFAVKKSFDFAWCLRFFEKHGKELYGKTFSIDPQDHETIYKLLVYFLNIPSEARKHGIDLRKGLLITGPIGCGKTAWLNLMRGVPLPERNYYVKACRDVTFEFVQEGYEIIHRYSRFSYRNDRPKTFAFDDLGTEQNLKHYGNECNVMGEILLSRYDHFTAGMITHVTTNLSANEIEAIYGNRLRSRMRQMFNLVAFGRESRDKRQ